MRSGTMYRTELFSRIGVKATGARVLDIGAFDTYWLSTQDVGLRVGVDLDIQPRPDCNGIRGDGLNLPFPAGAFDNVFAFDVIEHVDDDRRFLAELVRVAKPGGTITLTTPNANLRIFPSFLTPWAHKRWGHHQCQGYRAEQLRELLREAGAPDIRVQELRTWFLLTFFLPLSLVARASQRLGRLGFRLAAMIDSRWLREGAHGYLLATVQT